MAGFNVFVFILCLVIFVLLTTLISYLIIHNHKLEKQAILCGQYDERIIKEHNKKAKESTAARAFTKAFNVLLLAFFGSLLLSSAAINISSRYGNNEFSTIRVVESNSMSKKEKMNDYLYQFELDNQFQMFDIIVTHKLPKEEDLNLFDIVVYSQDGIDVIHRIVGIEEPNESHPDCRHFVLRGDANVYNDREPVLYSQMKAIYRNEKISFVGSFILFLQAPAGFLCIGLVALTPLVSSILESKIDIAINERLIMINYINFETLRPSDRKKLEKAIKKRREGC